LLDGILQVAFLKGLEQINMMEAESLIETGDPPEVEMAENAEASWI
jgi:hypothetical protein